MKSSIFQDDDAIDSEESEAEVEAEEEARDVDDTGMDIIDPDKAQTGEKTTTKYMTKYERARLLGTRALQIRFDAFLCEQSPSILLSP